MINDFLNYIKVTSGIELSLMLVVTISILFIVFQSVWRRCFGSDGWNIPILKERGVQHAINIIVLMTFFFYVKGYNVGWTVYATLVVQGLFYTLSFYVAMDMGRALPDEQGRKDYDSLWGKITDVFYPTSEAKYTFGYDLLWFGFRYTLPLMLLLPVMTSNILFAGILTTLSYAYFWNYFAKKGVFGGTDYGEYAMGFFIGLFITIS